MLDTYREGVVMNILSLRFGFFLITTLGCMFLFFKNNSIRDSLYKDKYSDAVVIPHYDNRFYIDKARAFNIIVASHDDGVLYSINDLSIDDYNKFINYLYRMGIFPTEFNLVQGEDYGTLRINSLRLERYE